MTHWYCCCLQVPYWDLYVRTKLWRERVIDGRRDSERSGRPQNSGSVFTFESALQSHNYSQTGFQQATRTMEAIAKYDFKATADDELSFKRGEILKVNVNFFPHLMTCRLLIMIVRWWNRSCGIAWLHFFILFVISLAGPQCIKTVPWSIKSWLSLSCSLVSTN